MVCHALLLLFVLVFEVVVNLLHPFIEKSNKFVVLSRLMACEYNQEASIYGAFTLRPIKRVGRCSSSS